MRETYGAEGKEYVWESKDLITYDEVYRIIADRVKADSHPLPAGCVGELYTVGGVATASRAILKHIGGRVESLHKKEEEE